MTGLLMRLCGTKQFYKKTPKDDVGCATSAVSPHESDGSTGGMLSSHSGEPSLQGLLPEKRFACKLHLIGSTGNRISLKSQEMFLKWQLSCYLLIPYTDGVCHKQMPSAAGGPTSSCEQEGVRGHCRCLPQEGTLYRLPAERAHSRGWCLGALLAHLQGLEGLHELLQLVWWQKVSNEVLAPAHLRQLLGPLCPEKQER